MLRAVAIQDSVCHEQIEQAAKTSGKHNLAWLAVLARNPATQSREKLYSLVLQGDAQFIRVALPSHEQTAPIIHLFPGDIYDRISEPVNCKAGLFRGGCKVDWCVAGASPYAERQHWDSDGPAKIPLLPRPQEFANDPSGQLCP